MSSESIEALLVLGAVMFAVQYLFRSPEKENKDEDEPSSPGSSTVTLSCEEQQLSVHGLINQNDTEEIAKFHQVYDNKHMYTTNDPNTYKYCNGPGSVLQKMDDCGYICSGRDGRFELFGTNFDSNPLEYTPRGRLNSGYVFQNNFVENANTFMNVDPNCVSARLDQIWMYDPETYTYDFPNTCYDSQQSYFKPLSQLNETCNANFHCDTNLQCGSKTKTCLYSEFMNCNNEDECADDLKCVPSCETDVCTKDQQNNNCVSVEHDMSGEKNKVGLYFYLHDTVVLKFYVNIYLSKFKLVNDQSYSYTTTDYRQLVQYFNIKFNYYNKKEKCYNCAITLSSKTMHNDPHDKDGHVLYFNNDSFEITDTGDKYVNLYFKDDAMFMITNQPNTKILSVDESNTLKIIDKPTTDLTPYYRWQLYD